jgi:YgiT-type zinc finger domain-containing protein
MTSLEQLLDGLVCPRCGWENSFVIRPIEVVLKVGKDTVAVKVTAGVCDHCGEEILDKTASDIIDDAIRHVREGDTAQLVQTGAAYQYPG